MAENSESQTKTPPQTPRRSAIDQLFGFFKRVRSTSRLAYYRIGNIEKSNMELGIKQMREGKFYDAGLRFKFVLWLNKRNVIAHYLLGKCYFYRGKLAEAISPLQQALKLQPDLEEARFLLACCGANANIKSVPRSFIIDKLDLMAVSYENFVDNTASKVNTVLAHELKKIIGENMGFNVLDLGARGGDTSQVVRKSANFIIGVEPSLKLVAIARTRRFDNLLAFNQIAGRFPEDFLRENKEQFAVVLSTYYMDNIGPLDEYFKLIANAVETKGIFAFNINPNDGKSDYTFKPNTMLFTHSPTYVEKLLAANGFKIVSKQEAKYPSGNLDFVYITVKE